MRQTIKVFSIGMRAVRRDAIMLVLIPAPFFIGALFRILAPLLDGLLVRQFAFSLQPWYPFVDALTAALAPLMPTVSSGFLLLEEWDEHIGSYYNITPAGRFHYLAARVGLPALWGFVCCVVTLLLFGLSAMVLPTVLALSLVAALAGAASAMLIVSLAANRVEGLAVSKLSGIALLGLPVAYFVPDAWRWSCAILPSFWLGELALGKPPLLPLAWGLAASLLWIAFFTKRFLRKIE